MKFYSQKISTLFTSLQKDERGLTFIELVVVMGIFAVLASIVLFRFRSFGIEVGLNNLTQDVALHIVGAQKQAISGAYNPNFTATGGNTATLGAQIYGIYFQSALTLTPGANDQFIYFSDANEDKIYTPNITNTCPATPTLGQECIAITRITTKDYVSKICYKQGAASACTDPSNPYGVHLTFKRPFPDASLYITNGNAAPLVVDKVYIELTSGNDAGLKKTIMVTSLGRVSVHNGDSATALANLSL